MIIFFFIVLFVLVVGIDSDVKGEGKVVREVFEGGVFEDVRIINRKWSGIVWIIK